MIESYPWKGMVGLPSLTTLGHFHQNGLAQGFLTTIQLPESLVAQAHPAERLPSWVQRGVHHS